MKTTLFTEDGFFVYEENSLSNEVESLLMNTVWGAEGLRYKHKNAGTKIDPQSGQRIFTLYFQTNLAACVVFDTRTLYNKGEERIGAYIRYFAASRSFKGKGIVKSFCQKVFQHIIESSPEGMVIHGLIESANQTSYSIANALGFSSVRKMAVLPISRLFPKKHKHVYGTCNCEKDEYDEFLKTAYKDHNFIHVKNIYKNSDYLVYRVKGEILAGVQVHKAAWELENMPNATVNLLLKLFSHLPVFKNIYNNNTLHFLGLEGVYFQEGQIDKFYKILEHAMFEHKLNAALYFADKESVFYKKLLESKQNGIISNFSKENEINFMVHTSNLTEQDISDFKAHPAYISAYDTI